MIESDEIRGTGDDYESEDNQRKDDYAWGKYGDYILGFFLLLTVWLLFV